MSKLKKKGKKTYKKKAWKAFSEYIRRKYAHSDGNCACVTCNKIFQWKALHAGHFIDSRNNSVLFNEEIVYPQCKICNLFKSGNKVKYVMFMLKKGYTMEQLNEFDNLKFKTKKYTEADYEEIYEKYKAKCQQLQQLDKSSVLV